MQVSPATHFTQANFVRLVDIVPSIKIDLRYATTRNFTGSVVPGYLSKDPRACLCTRAAAERIAAVQQELLNEGYGGLLVWDFYRPCSAVLRFVEWATCGEPENEKIRSEYYPCIASREELFDRGFISKTSAHCRGSTVDLTVVDKDGQPLDMGTDFDLFHERSYPSSDLVTPEQRENRKLLQRVMNKHGFKVASTEWWHFSFATRAEEPYPDTSFDFAVTDR